VVLTDAVGVQADLVGALDLLQQVLHPLEGGDVDAGLGIGHRRDEAVDADVHGVLLSCAAGPATLIVAYARTGPYADARHGVHSGRRPVEGAPTPG
jgi:hypothetical protein